MENKNKETSNNNDTVHLGMSDVMPCFNYNDFEQAFIAGYKLRAEMSGLTFDFASELYAKSKFIKWNSNRLK